MFVWETGDFTARHAIDTLGVAWVKANSVASNVGSYVLVADEISPRDAGAKGDNVTNDTAALDVWFAVLMNSTYGGRIDGQFVYQGAPSWVFQLRATKGLTIEGDDQNSDFIRVASQTGPFVWSGNSVALFYLNFRSFGIMTNYAGIGWQVGQDNFGDAWNQCNWDNVVTQNFSANAAAVAIRWNHVLHSVLDTTANCAASGRPGSGTEPGLGIAVQMRQVISCRGGNHAGNANIAHQYAGGYSYANDFNSNIEEVDTAFSVTSANATINTYGGCNIVCKTLFNATTGWGLILSDPNIQQYAGYSIGTNLVGCIIKFSIPRTHLSTPTIPATTVPYLNNTARPVQVLVRGGTVTNIRITAPDTGNVDINPQTQNQCPPIILFPGWTIILTYTGSPVWSFLTA